MSDFSHQVDLSAGDQAGLTMLAQGDDLFDLGHLTSGAPASTTPSDGPVLASDLLSDHAMDWSHAVEAAQTAGSGAYLQVAAADQPVVTPHPVVEIHDAAAPTVPETVVPSVPGGHAPNLTLSDVLADAADDLASFHTAAGPAANHGPVGSGFFTPFNPPEILPGLSELHVLHGA